MPDIELAPPLAARNRTTNDLLLARAGAASPFDMALLNPDGLFPNGFPVPVLSADPGSPADGLCWYNSTSGQLKLRLDGRTLAFSAVESPVIAPASGQYVLCNIAPSGGNLGTLAGAANRVDLFPWSPAIDLTAVALSINCTTLVASAQAKIVVYAADADGKPDALLFESGTVDLSTTGVKDATAALTFRRGTIYWLGVRHSSTATISTISANGAPDLTGTVITTFRKVLRRTVAFASAAPNPWVYSAAEGTVSVAPPAIWVKA